MKKKLPKSGCRLFPPGCGRPCDHASDPVPPQMLGLPVVAQRQVPTCMLHSSWCSSWTWFLTCPLWCFDRCLVRWCRKLWFFRSCSSSTVVDIPFVPQILMVQSIQQTTEITQLLFDFRCCAGRACHARGGAAVAASSTVMDVPVILQRRWVATLEVPQIQFIAGVGGHPSSQQLAAMKGLFGLF